MTRNYSKRLDLISHPNHSGLETLEIAKDQADQAFANSSGLRAEDAAAEYLSAAEKLDAGLVTGQDMLGNNGLPIARPGMAELAREQAADMLRYARSCYDCQPVDRARVEHQLAQIESALQPA